MPSYACRIAWSRGDAAFTDRRYSRAHRWHFDGGAVVPASSSPHSVPLPWSDPAAVDPEEALVAAVSSCHMLWFLALAAEAGCVVDAYEDAAEGRLGRFADGREGIVEIALRPVVVFSGSRRMEQGAVDALHRAAHARCYIANSVRGEVRVEGSWRMAASEA